MKLKQVFISLFSMFVGFNANAASVEQLLKITITPFDAIDCTFSYSLDNGSYTINTELTTTGMFGKIYPFSGKYFADGKIEKGNFIQKSYEKRNKSRFNKRRNRLFYDSKGHLIKRISEKNDKRKIFYLQDHQADEGVNLPTVFIKLIKQVQIDGNCASTHKVFNGKRSFNVVFKDFEKEDPFANENADRSIKCLMHIESTEEEEDNLLFNASAGAPVTFWMRRDQQTNLPYIEKIEAKYSKFGYITVQSEKVDVKR